MIYTKMTCAAARIAYKAHEGQVDVCGMPYIMHPLHVAEQMQTEEEAAAALLHDVIEDTDLTLDDLRTQGISEEVVEAVDLLTNRGNMSYKDYLLRIKTNPIALAVKLADVTHNMDETRLYGLSEPLDRERSERWHRKYPIAKKLLLGIEEDD